MASLQSIRAAAAGLAGSDLAGPANTRVWLARRAFARAALHLGHPPGDVARALGVTSLDYVTRPGNFRDELRIASLVRAILLELGLSAGPDPAAPPAAPKRRQPAQSPGRPAPWVRRALAGLHRELGR